jgi:hypothetical protein
MNTGHTKVDFGTVSPAMMAALLGTVALCLLLVACQGSNCQSERTPGAHSATTDGIAADRKKFVKLIDGLENHNPPPIIPVPPGRPEACTPIFDKNYDWHEQERVKRTIQRLVEHADDAWPEIIDHLDDKRYCMTYESMEQPRNFTVGEICRQIISDTLSWGYMRHWSDEVEYGREQSFHRMSCSDVARNGDLKAWCESRSAKKLYELQIEMCEWAMPKVAQLTEPTDEDKRAWIAAIAAQIEDFREFQRPVLPDRFGNAPDAWECYTPERLKGIEEWQRESDHSGDAKGAGRGMGMF